MFFRKIYRKNRISYTMTDVETNKYLAIIWAKNYVKAHKIFLRRVKRGKGFFVKRYSGKGVNIRYNYMDYINKEVS